MVFLLSLPLALYPKEMSVLEEPTKMTAKKAAKPHKTPSAQPTPHDFKPKGRHSMLTEVWVMD